MQVQVYLFLAGRCEEAIDFYKKGAGGRAISIGGTREFRWLKRNAHRFGLYNLPSEPWHWSTNGH